MDSKFLNSVEKTGQRSLTLEGAETYQPMLGPLVLHAIHYLGISPTASPSSWSSQYSLQPSPQGSDYHE